MYERVRTEEDAYEIRYSFRQFRSLQRANSDGSSGDHRRAMRDRIDLDRRARRDTRSTPAISWQQGRSNARRRPGANPGPADSARLCRGDHKNDQARDRNFNPAAEASDLYRQGSRNPGRTVRRARDARDRQRLDERGIRIARDRFSQTRREDRRSDPGDARTLERRSVDVRGQAFQFRTAAFLSKAGTESRSYSCRRQFSGRGEASWPFWRWVLSDGG